MARPRKKSARSADEWLLNGAEGEEPRGPGAADHAFVDEEAAASGDLPPDSALGAETSQWLVVPGPELNGTKDAAAGEAPTEAEELEPQQDSDLARRVRELQTALRVQEREAKAELAKALEKERAELQGRIDELESAVAAVEQEAEATKPPGTRRAGRGKDEPDLNRATFEELRNLGLSVTQSARVIAYRDVRGGFESLDELDDIPGLPKETRADLRKRLTLSS